MSDVRIVSLVGGVLVLLVMVELLRRRQLKEKYAALWLAVALAIAVLAVAPGLLDTVARSLAVADPVNLLLFVGMLVLLSVCVHLSWECSRLEDETRALAEEIALLRNDLEQRRPSG